MRREKSLDSFLKNNNVSEKELRRMINSIRQYQVRKIQPTVHDFSGKHIRIGVLGDTHFGNRWADKDFLNSIMDHFKNVGVEAVYHTGDLTDGPWQRHNNILEQYAHGIEAQVDDFVKDFPDIGKKTYLITGNHDDWYIKMGAGNPGKLAAAQRSDLVYLGQSEGLVRMGQVNMLLHHPDKGSAYAYSYNPQKFVEAMFKMEERVPDIILQGHYHKLFQMHFGGVAYFNTGTIERQTPFMRGKNVAADMGAWVLDIYRDSHKRLKSITSTILPYKGERHKPFYENGKSQ